MPVIEIRDASYGDLPGILRVLAESGIDTGVSFTVEEARAHLDSHSLQFQLPLWRPSSMAKSPEPIP
jgi:hypothetical protein